MRARSQGESRILDALAVVRQIQDQFLLDPGSDDFCRYLEHNLQIQSCLTTAEILIELQLITEQWRQGQLPAAEYNRQYVAKTRRLAKHLVDTRLAS